MIYEKFSFLNDLKNILLRKFKNHYKSNFQNLRILVLKLNLFLNFLKKVDL